MANVTQPAQSVRTIPVVDSRPWQFIALQIARALLLGSFMYGAWRYGGTEPVALQNTSLALVLAGLLALVSGRHFKPDQPLPAPLLICGLLWILYAGVQTFPLAAGTTQFFQSVVATHDEFASTPIAELQNAIASLEGPVVATSRPRATVALDETRWALVPYLLGLAFAYLTWRLFSTNRSRRVFLWAIVVHSTLIAAWGILQRAGGNIEMLPGIPDRFPGIPFSSFIYKNAGAAAILPGAAAAVLLSTMHLAKPRSQRTYHATSRYSQPYHLILGICFVVIGIGVLVSLSRGAWLAAMIAAFVAVVLHRRWVGRRVFGIVSAVLLGALITSMVAGQIGDSVQTRLGDLSLDVVVADQRWDQWKDGWQTAVAHFPSGSGLGTYGYAALPYQTHTRTAWFREAHNQYLEIATESGLIGILIFVFLWSWFLKTCLRALRSKYDQLASWATFGIAILLLASIQSIADFVIVIPSNLFLYACLTSLVSAQCGSFPAPRRTTRILTSSLWTMVILAALAWAILICKDQILEGRILASTAIKSSEQSSRGPDAQDKITQLDQAIALNSQSPELFERRAAWKLLQYRGAVVDLAQQRGINLNWQATEPINILNVLYNAPEDARSSFAADFVSSGELRESLAEVLADFTRVLQLNPLRPYVHIKGASLASISGFATLPWLVRSAKLSNNHSGKLFRNGLTAFAIRDEARMIDQWSKSLAVNTQYLDEIITLAQQRVSLQRVAREIIPAKYPHLLVQLAHLTSPPDAKFVRDLIDQCEHANSGSEPRNEAAIAELYQVLGDMQSAAKHWEKALTLDPRSAVYRLSYAQALLRTGQAKLALDQAILGRALFTKDDRFRQLIDAARGDLAKSK